MNLIKNKNLIKPDNDKILVDCIVMLFVGEEKEK